MAYQVIVVGLGGMGSSALYHLARRLGGPGRVLGLDRGRPPHESGSSHGRSRVIRKAYYEHPSYVPLLLRAYELWAELERELDAPGSLLTITGGLMLGRRDAETITGSLRSAEEHGLAHELLDASAIRRRFPPLAAGDDVWGLYEPDAGYLDPERVVAAQLERAAAWGAEIVTDTPILDWSVSSDGDGVVVRTAGASYRAQRLVLAVGPWVGEQLRAEPESSESAAGRWAEALAQRFVVTRQVLYWFEPSAAAPFSADRFPIYIWETEAGTPFYGFPAQPGPPGGVKVAFHDHRGLARCTPATVERSVSEAEIAAMRACLARHIPTLAGRCLHHATCLYTETPDHHFVVGALPGRPQVILASPCSGHGFKFASVMGEILADLSTSGTTNHAIGRFAPERLLGDADVEGGGGPA